MPGLGREFTLPAPFPLGAARFSDRLRHSPPPLEPHMCTPSLCRLATLLAVLGSSAGLAAAQSSSITVDCSGATISSTGSTPDIVRTSPTTTTILPAFGYTWGFNPIVSGSGLSGSSVIGTNRPMFDVLNGLFTGGGRTLFGAMRNPSGTLPTRLDFEVVATVVSGFNISLTFDEQLLATGQGQSAIRNIVRPALLIGLTVNSGGLVVNTFTPPAPVKSEWHFDGNLQSVKESGLAPTSGPSKIRYLDDPAFGPVLGGVGGELVYPSPATPTGVTQAQSAFGTTTAFGIPNLGTSVDTVYRTSPPRNATAPTDTAKSRGLGLALWPNTRDIWPDERLGQWTIIADILIPQSSWDSARSNTAANNQCIPLIESSQNNNSSADAFLTVTGSAPGAARIGNTVPYASALAAPAVQPNQWFRVAIVNNLYGAAASRVFVNGTLVGTTGADWVYNACKSLDPRWGDNMTPPPASNATAIPAATWNGWGQFPSPWAYSQSPTGTGTATGAPTAATLGLFCDINGWGESVYVANLLFTDEPMSDAAVTALGGPNARGIVYLRAAPPPPCPADFNGANGLTVQDIFDFLAAWFAGTPTADFNGVNGITVQDIFDFLSAWFAGCP